MVCHAVASPSRRDLISQAHERVLQCYLPSGNELWACWPGIRVWDSAKNRSMPSGAAALAGHNTLNHPIGPLLYLRTKP